MTLFFTLLPLYLLGNLHCMGMCGPLVALLQRHRFRHLYFVGRILSFSLVGALSAEVGMLFTALLKRFYFPALTSICFGTLIFVLGLGQLLGKKKWVPHFFKQATVRLSQRLGALALQHHPWATFAFGLSTILLPCGQTVIVFSAIALSSNVWTGLFNGCAFAVLTTPALLFSMEIVGKIKWAYAPVMGSLICLTALLLILRGVADLGWVPHATLSRRWHIALF